MAIVIGLDVGTSGTKAIAMDAKGTLLAASQVVYPLDSPRPGWAEQDPALWKAAAFEALAQLAHQVKADEVTGIGLTGQMHGSVFLDGANNVLRPALLWCDQRTAPQCDEITRTVGAGELLEMVSNPALPGFTAPKILWLREHEPAIYEQVVRVLLPKDYIRLVLTGEYATDVADASGTLLFDVKNRNWHTDLMSILGIDPDFMPRAFEGTEVTGTLTPEAAQKTGLPAGIPVVAGGGDQAAGGVGCGIVRPGVISSTLGTSGVTFAFSEKVAMDPQGRVHTFCHAVPGAWHVMGVMLAAGGSLQWFRDMLCQAERTVAAETGRDPYEYITEAAAKVPHGAEGLIFLPYLSGERTPHKDPYAKGAFIGLSLRHSKAHMARAVLEGVAMGMRDSLELITGMGVPVDEIRASGGGARSPLWRRIMTDVHGMPFWTINVDEGPSYGAAILASVAAGFYKDVPEACDTIIRTVDESPVESSNVHFYDMWYREYQNAYNVLAPSFQRCAEILR
ncbi:MAG: xylulokinase [Candidatus Hydrogenedentota bacterium]